MPTKRATCPVCNEQHFEIGRESNYSLIACPKVTPSGVTRTFPGLFLKVLGAGTYVDEQPARTESADDKKARLAAAEQELNKLREQEEAAKRVTELDERLAKAEAELAAKKSGRVLTDGEDKIIEGEVIKDEPEPKEEKLVRHGGSHRR